MEVNSSGDQEDTSLSRALKRAFPSLAANDDIKTFKGIKYKEMKREAFEFNMRNKDGSSLDRDALIEAMKALGFSDKEITVKNNMRRADMMSLMNRVASADYTDANCVFVSILSHGDEDLIYAVDEPVFIDELLSPFKEKGSESLIGKPKIFLFQACRGLSYDDGVFQIDGPKRDKKHIHRIAKESDFLLAYSTVPGHYSWRTPGIGSWFIQTVCEVIRHDGRKLEFVHLLTRVNQIVSYYFESNTGVVESHGKKVSPCIVSTLTKELYFG